MTQEPESTDITLFVRTSDDEVTGWDRRRIVSALVREAGVAVGTAEEISREVERQICSSGIGVVTAPLIRELVDAKLVERGMEEARRRHARVGFPLYDVERIILHPNREVANLPHGPEGTNLILAEGVKREYALQNVFSREVADAHVRGDIHIHGLGAVDRLYGVSQSLAYIKRFGLDFPRTLTAAKPAKHAEVLLAHMVRFSAVLQGYVAATVSWRALNLSFAPYVAAMGEREIRQFAQMLVYEFSQMAAGRGGQPMFTDIHLLWEVPPAWAGLPIIGPGGEVTDRPVKDYELPARRFARALLEVYGKGDGRGRPFTFPRPILHVTEGFFSSPGREEVLAPACRVAVERGNPCFFFHRPDEASRPGVLPGLGPLGPEISETWDMRDFALHHVTINLPRLAYRAEGDEERLSAALREAAGLALAAHEQKVAFLERLLSFGEDGPLSVMAMDHDGHPYFRKDLSYCLLGVAGLDEMAAVHAGAPLHASEEAMALAARVLAALRRFAEEEGGRRGLRVFLDGSHAETTTHRFARLDLRYHSPRAGRFVKGDPVSGALYYTDGVRCDVGAPLAPFARIAREGRLHPCLDGETATFIWLGDGLPPEGELMDLLERAYKETTSRQVVIAPDFTTCLSCGATGRGLRDRCPSCASPEVEGIAAIGPYISRVSGWNRGKRAELADRYRTPSLRQP